MKSLFWSNLAKERNSTLNVVDSERQTYSIIKALRAIGNNADPLTVPDQYLNKRLKDELSAVFTKVSSLHEGRSHDALINTGLLKLSNIINEGRRSDFDTSLRMILNHLSLYSSARFGLIYVAEEQISETVLIPKVGYGCRVDHEKVIYPGSGQVGQCFIEKRPLELENPPGGYIKVTSGLGSSSAVYVLILPLVFHEKICGVIELAFFEKITDATKEFLTRAAETVAVYVLNIQEQARIERLLNDAETYKNQLLVNEEALKQNLEEMHAIQEELQRQNNLLANAQIELEAKHEELNRRKQEEQALLDEKLQAQQAIYDTIVNRLKKKITSLEDKLVLVKP